MNEPQAYWNGRLVPQAQLHVPIRDAGFVFGATVTDQCRTFRHRLFRLEAHIRRFEASCRLAFVPLQLDPNKIAAIAEELVAHNRRFLSAEEDMALVMVATPGEVGQYLAPSQDDEPEPTLFLYTHRLAFERYAPLRRRGGRLVVVRLPAPRHLIPPQIKHRSRLHWWMAERRVHQVDPTAIPLYCDPAGRVRETTTANVLFVHGGTVWSPPQSEILPGVSVDTVQTLCHQQGIPFRESEIDTASPVFREAEEVLLCSTPYGIAPVSQVDGRPISWPGPVFQRLIQAWNESVGLDIWRQIESAGGTDSD